MTIAYPIAYPIPHPYRVGANRPVPSRPDKYKYIRGHLRSFARCSVTRATNEEHDRASEASRCRP